jgi:hypothetical protein
MPRERRRRSDVDQILLKRKMKGEPSEGEGKFFFPNLLRRERHSEKREASTEEINCTDQSNKFKNKTSKTHSIKKNMNSSNPSNSYLLYLNP